MMAETKEFISKGRLDALTDAVFAFPMTLLVVNFDLPEEFHPTSAAEPISALLGLGDTFTAYRRQLERFGTGRQGLPEFGGSQAFLTVTAGSRLPVL